MLEIIVPKQELYDSEANLFTYTPEVKLTLEHSLISISKWESKWHKAYMSNDQKTREEALDYVRCMIISPANVDKNICNYLTNENFKAINAYIEDPMTATWFSKEQSRPSREVITSELIYYWMIALNIPMECQKWHLNRLLTLIKVCSIKNQPSKSIPKNELMARNRALNAARKAKMHTKG